MTIRLAPNASQIDFFRTGATVVGEAYTWGLLVWWMRTEDESPAYLSVQSWRCFGLFVAERCKLDERSLSDPIGRISNPSK